MEIMIRKIKFKMIDVNLINKVNKIKEEIWDFNHINKDKINSNM